MFVDWKNEAERLGISNEVITLLSRAGYSIYKHKSKQAKGFIFPNTSLGEFSCIVDLVRYLPRENPEKGYLMVNSGFVDIMVSAEYTLPVYSNEISKNHAYGVVPRFVLFENESLVKFNQYSKMQDMLLLSVTENEISGAVKTLAAEGFRVGVQPRHEPLSGATYDILVLNS